MLKEITDREIKAKKELIKMREAKEEIEKKYSDTMDRN